MLTIPSLTIPPFLTRGIVKLLLILKVCLFSFFLKKRWGGDRPPLARLRARSGGSEGSPPRGVSPSVASSSPLSTSPPFLKREPEKTVTSFTKARPVLVCVFASVGSPNVCVCDHVKRFSCFLPVLIKVGNNVKLFCGVSCLFVHPCKEWKRHSLDQ